jgi:DNA ligase-1
VSGHPVTDEQCKANNYSILLVTGIANSYNLKEYVQKISNDVIHLNFSDHHLYKRSDIKKIEHSLHTIENPRFWVFDILTLEEFDSGKGETKLTQRLTRMDFTSAIILKLPQSAIADATMLTAMRDHAKSQGWEGLIARRDVGYEGDRTKNMLKLKDFYDAEYVVKSAVMEKQRVIVEGREVEEEVLSAVLIEHKGNFVRVGSGFSMEERREYYANPEKIIGKVINVQYFEETVDQHGNNSLRFPVFKWNHGKSRSI